MKCLLRKEGRCFITKNLCNSPVELGDEENCLTFQNEFPQWFEKQVIRIAPEVLQWWIDMNTEGHGFDYETDEEVKQLLADAIDLLVYDVVCGLIDEGLETTISVIEEEDIKRILRKYHIPQ